MKKTILGKNFTIAIIGFGRFGQLLVKVISMYSQANILLISSKKPALSHKNISLGTMKDLRKADMIIPCVPISVFESVMKQIGHLIREDAIVMDICSVKVLPVKWMKENLLRSTQIIASHPMFGPDSYRIKKYQNDLKFVIYNISTKPKSYIQVQEFFNNLGWKIIELSPKDHDIFMATSLAYSYLIGKIGQRMNIKKTPIDTHDFQLLLDHTAIIKRDSEQLFIDMETQNPHASGMQKKFKKVIIDIFQNL